MNITTKYSIGDIVDLGLHKPPCAFQTARIIDMDIHVAAPNAENQPLQIKVEYWYWAADQTFHCIRLNEDGNGNEVHRA